PFLVTDNWPVRQITVDWAALDGPHAIMGGRAEPARRAHAEAATDRRVSAPEERFLMLEKIADIQTAVHGPPPEANRGLEGRRAKPLADTGIACASRIRRRDQTECQFQTTRLLRVHGQ